MLTSLTVKNFRNLRSVTLERLGRLTLIGGKNGVGKTALLEALWMFSGPDLPRISWSISSYRGLPSPGLDAVFHDMFRDYGIENSIKITAEGNWASDLLHKLEISLRERQQTHFVPHDGLDTSTMERMTRPKNESEHDIVFDYWHDDGKKYTSRAWWTEHQLTPAPGVPVSGEAIVQDRERIQNFPNSAFLPALYREDPYAVASMLGRVQLRGEDDKFLRLVRLLEPRLKRLALIAIKSAPVIHAYLDDRKRPLPVQLLGEGFNRMLGLALFMSEVTGGLLLIDEIENGLHHSVQEEVFSTLLDLARDFDVQIFATTHSSECIRAAHNALSRQDYQGEGEFVFHRLDRIDGEIKVASYDNEMLDTAEKFHMETR